MTAQSSQSAALDLLVERIGSTRLAVGWSSPASVDRG
jgi:hypothetical protein